MVPSKRVNFLTAVGLCNVLLGGIRRTWVDRHQAHHPNVCLKGGRGPGVRRSVVV